MPILPARVSHVQRPGQGDQLRDRARGLASITGNLRKRCAQLLIRTRGRTLTGKGFRGQEQRQGSGRIRGLALELDARQRPLLHFDGRARSPSDQVPEQLPEVGHVSDQEDPFQRTT